MHKLLKNVHSICKNNNLNLKRFYSNLTLDQQEYVDSLFDGVINNRRPELAKSITLIETTSPKKKILSEKLLNNVLFRIKDKKDNHENPCLRVG